MTGQKRLTAVQVAHFIDDMWIAPARAALAERRSAEDVRILDVGVCAHLVDDLLVLLQRKSDPIAASSTETANLHVRCLIVARGTLVVLLVQIRLVSEMPGLKSQKRERHKHGYHRTEWE